jgi:sialidase-1
MVTTATFTTKPKALFYSDYEGSKAYRIPTLLTTLQGTLIAGIDARLASARDNPNKIDTTIRRSTDNGETWEGIQKLVTYAGEGLDGSAAIDTSLLQDEQTNTIWMLLSHTPGGIGLWSCEAGTGFDPQGKRLLYDVENNAYVLHANGKVYDSFENETGYTVDETGNVWKKGIQKGNIYLKKGIDPNQSLLEARTSFLQIIKSEDDGQTWSKPIELNTQVKEPWMQFIGTGPGRGIQLKNGVHNGRLVFPIYFSNQYRKMSCAVIYSDDQGKTWKRGTSPNDGRIFNGKEISAETVSEENADLTESQVIELPNGVLKYYIRNHSGKQRTAVAESKDGGVSWGELSFDEKLVDPTCQSTIIKYPDLGDAKTRLLFANPADPHARKNGTVRLSEDGGITWPYAMQVEPGSFIYSCLTVLANGDIGILYETEAEEEDITIRFATFTLEALKTN